MPGDKRSGNACCKQESQSKRVMEDQFSNQLHNIGPTDLKYSHVIMMITLYKTTCAPENSEL